MSKPFSSQSILLSLGFVTSPNYPTRYPFYLRKIERIQIESGKMLRLKFTHFDVHVCNGINTCSCDHVKVTDGDGTTLMDKSCGISSRDPSDPVFFLLPALISRTNTIDIYFHTDDYFAGMGWILSWTAVTPGQKVFT